MRVLNHVRIWLLNGANEMPRSAMAMHLHLHLQQKLNWEHAKAKFI